MKCLIVRAKERPEVKDIKGDLKNLQEIVEGNIECVYPWEDNVGLICNEEGKIQGLPANRALYDEDNQLYDIVCGTFIIVGLGDDDFTDVSEMNLMKYFDKFEIPEEFYMTPNGAIAVKKMI